MWKCGHKQESLAWGTLGENSGPALAMVDEYWFKTSNLVLKVRVFSLVKSGELALLINEILYRSECTR